jgi:hypothetical protein
MEIGLLRPERGVNSGRDAAATGTGRHTVPPEFRVIARKLLTPGMVAEYAEEAGNRIHSDPALAARFGDRAPLASAHIALSYLLEALFAESFPDTLDLEASFLCPLYWNDGFDVLARTGAGGKPIAFHCVNPRHVLVIEAAIKA